MANQTLTNVRLINRVDTYTAWKNANPVLSKGEIALVMFADAEQDAANPGSYTNPIVAIKVGDGTTPFNTLKYAYAPASDVYEWAKASVKPTYTSGEIAFGDSTVEAAIEALELAVGSGGSVVQQINSAITSALADLDSTSTGTGKFVTAVTQTDGVVAVTMGDVAIADIANLQDELAKIATKLDKATFETFIGSSGDFGTLQATVNGHTETINNHTSAIEAIEDDIADINIAIGTGEGGLAKKLADETAAREDADEALGGRIDDLTAVVDGKADQADFNTLEQRVTETEGDISTLEGKVDALSSATHFLGVKDALPVTGANGDIVIVGNKEYVYDEASTAEVKWVELGDTTAEQARIGALETFKDEDVPATYATIASVNTLTQSVGAIDTRVGTAESEIDTLQEDVSKNTAAIAAEETRAKGVEDGLDERLADVEAEFTGENSVRAVLESHASQLTTLDQTVSANNTAADNAIKALQEADTAIRGEITAAVNELKSYADTAEADAISSAKSYTDTEVVKVDEKITTLTQNMADALHAADTFIIKCGNASTWGTAIV